MAKQQSKFKRGPAPRYPDLGYPSYGGYTRTPYPQKVRLSKDPRMLMEYRRPAFILAGTLRRFTGIINKRGLPSMYPALAQYTGLVALGLKDVLKSIVTDTSSVSTVSSNTTVNEAPKGIARSIADSPFMWGVAPVPKAIYEAQKDIRGE